MGHKITTLITTFVILLVFMIMVSFLASSSQVDETTQLISNFTEVSRYKGYITLSDYIELTNKIPYNNVKLQMTHIVNDVDKKYGLGTMDMRFSTQILGSEDDKGYKIRSRSGTYINTGTLLYNGDEADKGVYKMQIGDEFQVDLVVFDQTFYDVIMSTLTGSNRPRVKILTSSSGVVLNEQY